MKRDVFQDMKKFFVENKKIIIPIIIVFVLIIAALDIFWYARKKDNAENTNYNQDVYGNYILTVNLDTNGGYGGTESIYVLKTDQNSYRIATDSNMSVELQSIIIPKRVGYKFKRLW